MSCIVGVISVFVLTSMSVHLTPTGHLAGSEVTVNAEGKLDIRAALTKAKQVALDIVRQVRSYFFDALSNPLLAHYILLLLPSLN